MTTITDAIVKCVANSDGKSQMDVGRAFSALYDKPAQYKALCRIPFIRKLFEDLEELENVSDGAMEQHAEDHPDEFN